MIELEPPFRIATEADAPQLAELVNIAGEGLPLHLWQGMAGEAEDPWKIGRARQLAKTKESQIIVADFGNGAVASLTGYGIGAEPEPILADLSPILRPLLELENLALDSWYVNVLASFPDHRGKGLGSSLLNLAEQIALEEGLQRMSVVVADDNQGARRLYERFGFHEFASRPCFAGTWETRTKNWVLLLKSPKGAT